MRFLTGSKLNKVLLLFPQRDNRRALGMTGYNIFAETNEKLTEEMKKLKIDCLEKQQLLEELNSRLKLYSRVR